MSLRWNDDEASEQEERVTKMRERRSVLDTGPRLERTTRERRSSARVSRGRMASPSIGYAMPFPIVTKTRDSTHARISQQETITRYEKTTSPQQNTNHQKKLTKIPHRHNKKGQVGDRTEKA